MSQKSYTPAELRAFKAELETGGYRINKVTRTTKEKISYLNFDQYLIDKKACVRQHDSYAPAILNVQLYEELSDKWDQLCRMLNRAIYAEAKRLEQLAATQ